LIFSLRFLRYMVWFGGTSPESIAAAAEEDGEEGCERETLVVSGRKILAGLLDVWASILHLPLPLIASGAGLNVGAEE
jgi:hypothetical protein